MKVNIKQNHLNGVKKLSNHSSFLIKMIWIIIGSIMSQEIEDCLFLDDKKLDFISCLDFHLSLEETIKFDINKSGQTVLFPVLDSNTAHI